MRNGFTLLEVLIVIIITGVLAGLAVPVYQAQVQRAYEQEALLNLGQTRAAALGRFAMYGTYVGANIGAGTCNLEYCPNDLGTSGQTVHFNYFIATGPVMLIITAIRNNVAGGDGVSSISINQAGTITRTGVFSSGGGGS